MPTEIQGVTFYTTAEAAKELGISKNTARSMLKDGRIKGQKVGRGYLIPEKAIRETLGIQD